MANGGHDDGDEVAHGRCRASGADVGGHERAGRDEGHGVLCWLGGLGGSEVEEFLTFPAPLAEHFTSVASA